MMFSTIFSIHTSLTASVILLLIMDAPALVAAHGCMLSPNQRGGLSPRALYLLKPVPGAEDSNVDWSMHFPAGNKAQTPGSGKRSQEIAAGPDGWVPYNPYDPNFTLRAGPCGDTIDGNDHLKDGKFYDGGRISGTYTSGSVIDIVMAVQAHHNGFWEFHLCDVEQCPGGKMSQECFLSGHCWQLKRAKNSACDSGESKLCGPIDPAFPGRWYLPCENEGSPAQQSNGKGSYKRFGPGTIQYELPAGLKCERCVLQWYWAAANSCNPTGVIEYFEGDSGPKNWGQCPGQGGAKGGYSKVQKQCGKDTGKVSEEYYQCSDIRITAGDSTEEQTATNSDPSPSVSAEPIIPESTTPSTTPSPTMTPPVSLSSNPSASPSSAKESPSPTSSLPASASPPQSVSASPVTVVLSSSPTPSMSIEASSSSGFTSMPPSMSQSPSPSVTRAPTSDLDNSPLPSILSLPSMSLMPMLPSASASPSISPEVELQSTMPSSTPTPSVLSPPDSSTDFESAELPVMESMIPMTTPSSAMSDFPMVTIEPGSVSEYRPHTYGQGAIRDIILVRDGKRLQSLESDPFITYNADAKYSIEAYTTDTTSRVHFHVYDHNDNKVLVDQLVVREKNDSNKEGRLYLYGWNDEAGAPFPWKDVQRNHLLGVTIAGVDKRRFDIDRVYLQFS